MSDLSDTEIVAYLSTDDAPTRVLLRNVLAQGLSDKEKAVLRAVAAGDGAGLDAALTAAGFTDDPADDSDYWSKVKALLDRYNVGNIRVVMNQGSIDSRGDGIRAYYATPHDDNGGISVSVAEGARVTADLAGIHVANAGGDVTVTSGGTVLGMAEPGIYAANKAGAASDVTVDVTGGEVRSTGRNKPAVWAWNRGTGDVTVTIASGATAISKHATGIFALLGGAAGNRLEVTQGGTIMGRTGVYALAAHGTTAETVTPRAASAQPLIDVTWTGAFTHGTEADVAPDDEGRFAARTAGELIAFDRESAAGKAVEETIRWGAPAGLEAQVMSWREVAETAATGDDPGMLADDAARAMVFDTTSTDADLKAKSDALVRQAKAMLDNDEIVVEAGSALGAFIADMDANGDEEYTEEEIGSYLARDGGEVRAGLQALMALGLSEGEKAVLSAVAAGDGVDAALRAAGFTDDPDNDEDYWSKATALLDRYNTGNIRVAMNGGSIVSRGDGIRAWYATPHDRNGGISVEVAKGANVTGGMAGVYVANAGEGLMLARKYTPGYAKDDNPDELVAVMHGEGADAVALRNQLVTVAGTVIGGTDAAVHLSGGGAVLVMEGGRVHAGSSGVGVLVNDPGPAVAYVDGEVKGGPGGAAAVHLTGGGSVIVGLNGSVEANGADRAIRGGDTDETMVALTLVTDSMYRDSAEAANARVEGSIEDVEAVRFREDRDGVPTGYSRTLPVGDDGLLDTRGLPLRPCPEEGQTRGDDGVCAPTPSGPTDPGTDTDVDGIRVTIPGEGSTVSRDDGIRAYYETPHDDNDAIRVTVARNASVTGSMAGVYVANAGEGLMLARKYTPGFGANIAPGEDPGDPDEFVEVTHGAVRLLNQLVTVYGTVTGGTDAAVHLSGGGAVLVMEGGKVHAGASGVGILVNDPGPAVVYVGGEVKGGAGGAAAVHLTGGGSVIVGLSGRVQANGADYAIRGGGNEATKVAVTVVTDRMIEYPEDAEDAYERVEGALKDVDEVRFRVDENGVPTGYSKTLPVTDRGRLDTSGLPATFSCKEAMDGRCGLYEALPSMLLEMNGLASWAERTSSARDANGGWARVESARGKWRAKKAATAGELAYDHRRSGVRAGFDFLAGENARVGVSAHALGGKAQMSGVGEVELDGLGGGVSATWLSGDLYVDAQAGLTLYDVGVESYKHGELLKKDVDGAGYALGVEMGARMPVGRALVTPRGGLSWSKADLDDFMDMEAAGGPGRARVSVEGARSVKGRLGVMVETELGMGGSSGRMYGSLDVERELSDETEVKVGGQLLETEVRPASVHLGAGGVFEVAENVVVRAAAGYRTSGSGTSGYGGGLELQVRF